VKGARFSDSWRRVSDIHIQCGESGPEADAPSIPEDIQQNPEDFYRSKDELLALYNSHLNSQTEEIRVELEETAQHRT
jgi:hypothetical protein